MSNNQVQISVASTYGDLRLLIDVAGHAGVSRIHANWAQLHEWLVRNSIDVNAEMTRCALGENAQLAGLDLSTLAIECDDDLEARTDDAYMQMRVARNLGLGHVTLFGGARNAAAHEYLVAALLRLTTLADRLGLQVLLGNRRGTCLEQVDDVSRVLAEVGADNLHADVDIVEFHVACVNPCNVFLALGPQVARVRLSNIDGGCRASLEKGEINIPAVFRAIESVGCGDHFVLKLSGDRVAAAQLQTDMHFLESCGLMIG